MKKILFSPVGTMDPVASFADGPLVHIARKTAPDKIYIYISYELSEAIKDESYEVGEYRDLNRYEYCLRMLELEIQKENPDYHLEVCYVYGKKEEKIYEYNEMLQILRKYVNFVQEKHPEEMIYLNTSSGTPAMKYALYILYSVDKTGKLKGYQVTTPEKSINKREEKVEQYDAIDYWDCNEDNEGDVVDRTVELKDENLNYHFKKEALISHLNNYQYVAAYGIAKDIAPFLSEEALELLKFAADRIRLRPISGIDLKKYGIARLSSINEYILSLSAKLHNFQDADFIRGFTPVYVEILEKLLLRRFDFDVNDFVYMKGRDKGKWNGEELKRKYPEVYHFLTSFYHNFYGFILSDHLVKIYNYFAKDKDPYFEDIEFIREFESSIRNEVAHTLAEYGRETLKKKYNYTLEEVLKKLKRIANAADNQKTDWKEYETMNEVIVSFLN